MQQGQQVEHPVTVIPSQSIPENKLKQSSIRIAFLYSADKVRTFAFDKNGDPAKKERNHHSKNNMIRILVCNIMSVLSLTCPKSNP